MTGNTRSIEELPDLGVAPFGNFKETSEFISVFEVARITFTPSTSVPETRQKVTYVLGRISSPIGIYVSDQTRIEEGRLESCMDWAQIISFRKIQSYEVVISHDRLFEPFDQYRAPIN
jgi:hypothetical protein